jgi:exo-beta-1,3-glucanase (GH17 family)
MKSNPVTNRLRHPIGSLRAVLVVACVALLAACGGGGEVVVDAPASAVSTTNLRALPAEYLARKAVSYSPFRTATSAADRDNEVITALMVKEDLDLLIAGNFKLIRLFDSSDKVAKLVLDVIRDNNLDIKVHLGAYVNSFKYVLNPVVINDIKAKNYQELDRLIALATNPIYRDIVLVASVGNETMVVWSIVPIDPSEMALYIKYVRDRVTQPVTTDDNFLFFKEPPKIITDLLDFVAIHTYAEIDTQFPDSPLYWDWRQEGVAVGPARAAAMMNAAMVATRAQYQVVRDALDRKGLTALPIVIGETGWNAVNLGKLSFRAHPVNQKMYYTRLETWRAEGRVGPGPANVFYFEAFDEPWKGGDDRWGLFNVARQARYVIQNLNAASPSWQYEVVTSNADTLLQDTNNDGVFTDADAVHFVPPVLNPAVVATRYTLFSDTVVAGEIRPTLALDAFDGTTAVAPANDVAAAAPGDAPNGIGITPAPANYGWGLLYHFASGASENLSNFAASGTLNFSIKTTYAGKIEIAVQTDTENRDGAEAFLQIGNGDYGYQADGQWHTVSIPLQAFLAVNPKLDLRYVVSQFVIADRYAFTGKALGSNITTKLNVDTVFWGR